MNYSDFLNSKAKITPDFGFEVAGLTTESHLKPFQQTIVRWALRKGRAAIFADTGLGKTRMQLAWADEVCRWQFDGHLATAVRRVLILAPLAVAQQTVREGEAMGLEVCYVRSQSEVSRGGIYITNYEMLKEFDPSLFVGVVLDESSILKSYSGSIRNQIVQTFKDTPYRLACTATPAPNDHMELGNHSEFLGVMSRIEMLATFFVHDGGDTSEWRLKGHAVEPFWRWVGSWAVAVSKPSDIGFDDDGYVLPPLVEDWVEVKGNILPEQTGALFSREAYGLNEQRKAKRESLDARVARVLEIVSGEPDEQWLVWCEYNAESEALRKLLPNSVEVVGSDSPEHKSASLLGFADSAVRILVTKPSIAGFGMNWQGCARVVFVGVNNSYEQFYQAVRRCYRFGQSRSVKVWVIYGELERPVVENLMNKRELAHRMMTNMVNLMRFDAQDSTATARQTIVYSGSQRIVLPQWLRSA